ncbi:condensation domain-containing protein [Williamsia deligens]|uniref:Diacylglycerol O-acyltransferase n=1 Tax=Williamsia deligens TaxID=321325 RepID=A0ABW3G9W7_9NOCA|nr:hypothetical protein [Williamsia deligens]MCP2196187.1 hypothetical protein [Williamsia deligens]
MTTRGPLLRTTVDDDLFIRMDTALDVPVVNQMVWRLTAMPSEAELTRFADGLAHGRLARLLRRSRIPLVRDHWVAGGSDSGGLVVSSHAVAAGEVIAWIDAAASRPFDLRSGPVWEVRAAPLHTGGALVSLCLSHAVGDGISALTAFAEALSGDGTEFDPTPPTPLDQAREVIGRAATIAGSVAAIARDRVRVGSGPAAPDAGPVVTAATSPALPPTAPEGGARIAPLCVLSVETAEWEAAAARSGGSSNALFIAVVVGIVVAAGRAGADDVVRVSVPMSTREPDDDRANATTGLSLDVPAVHALDGDLAPIRALAREAYGSKTTRPTAFVRLQPLVQALGDRAVALLSAGATTPLALASSLGRVDPAVAGFGDPARADAVVTRATTQSITTARLRSLRGGLAAWVNDAAGTTTLSVVGLDPDALGPDVLESVVTAELRRWSLQARPW